MFDINHVVLHNEVILLISARQGMGSMRTEMKQNNTIYETASNC